MGIFWRGGGFNDAFNIETIALDGRMTDWWTEKDVEENGHGLNEVRS
jgi:hypothetical protein